MRDGVAFFDLTAIFRDVTDTVYIDDCCHLTYQGRDILAREVAQRVVAIHRIRDGAAGPGNTAAAAN